MRNIRKMTKTLSDLFICLHRKQSVILFSLRKHIWPKLMLNAKLLSLQETVEYMNNKSKTLTFCDKFEFVNIWHLMILINDVLFISGSIVKILLENKVSKTYTCNLFLLPSGCYWLYCEKWLQICDLWKFVT